MRDRALRVPLQKKKRDQLALQDHWQHYGHESNATTVGSRKLTILIADKFESKWERTWVEGAP
jgi:hypothetical protein